MTRRLLPHPALSVLLVLVWLAMLNNISFGGLLVGLLVGWAVPLFTASYWPNRPKLRWGRHAAEYAGVVLWDILVANFQVAWLILFRRSATLRSCWLVVPLDVRSPEAITALAATISLTPGTVSVDVAADGRALLVHSLDAPDPQAEVARIKNRYEARLMRFFR